MRESGSAARMALTLRALPSAGAVFALVGLAGCGTAAVVTGPHKQPANARHHAVVTVSRRTADPAAWAKAQARTVAKRMLARQVVPARARRLPARGRLPWALQLAENINDPGFSVRLTQAYLVPSPESVVIDFLRNHFPGGRADSSFGTGGSDPEQYITYRLPAMPDGVTGTLFFAGVLADGPARTWLRLDAMVDWTLPRTPAEHIDAARYRAVVITGFDPVSRRTRTRTFTAQSVIAELARQLNATHTTGSDYNCPMFAGGDSLTFEPKPGQAPLVSVQEGPCAILAITVGGKKQPGLGFGYHMLAFADRLVGIS